MGSAAAVVLLSGGQHSAAALLAASTRFQVVCCLHVAVDHRGSGAARAATRQAEFCGYSLDLAPQVVYGDGYLSDMLRQAAGEAVRRRASAIVLGLWDATWSAPLDATRARLREQMAMPGLTIHTPLFGTTADMPFGLAHDRRALPLVVERSLSCESTRVVDHQPHDWGVGCGRCPGCRRRAEGWRTFSASLDLIT